MRQNSPMDESLTKKQILAALEELNQKLMKSGTTAEICLYGGTSMVLAFNARLSTRDVDAVFKPKGIVKRLAEEVAKEHGLPAEWMNDGVKGFLSPRPKFTSANLPTLSHIQITRPTAEYLFAMKCMAARAPGYDTNGDRGDIKFLMQHLNIQTQKEALSILDEFYDRGRMSPKSQFLILECLQELNHGKAP